MQIKKAYFDQLFESTKEAILMTTNEGRVLRVNSEFVRLFGYTREEIIGKLADELVATKNLFEEAASFTKSVAEGERISSETVRCRKDGTRINVSILGAPIIIGDKQVAVFYIYRDITERKRAEEKIKK